MAFVFLIEFSIFSTRFISDIKEIIKIDYFSLVGLMAEEQLKVELQKLGKFKSLKEAIQFIYRYVHRYPEWFNGSGDVNEYNNKQSRPDIDDTWHENVFKN
ncbi:hypothetical protein COE84_20800 [Bacillus wiedmannii]|uniref:hypothetical protein n=1 Tax=Bacillus wiedmannii TaxID=1890302 RepID=UPI000BF5AEBE|nr:hypothetical protein [Bacillus wiedmannii]PGD59869.1 hypothetical protein COM40_02770 [Bacillus wiedmannii]PHA19369.1 hypothetical protein COE59_30060 [Bacillus wiedmannii]PHB10595.1 hypothetical protein COE84_20800 [Bacillus wiedmannii]